MRKKFVPESLNELYGKGYTSTSTAGPFDDEDNEHVEREPGRKFGNLPLSRRDQHERTRDWERRYGKDTPADQGMRAARKENAPRKEDKTIESPFYDDGFGKRSARPGYKQYHLLKALLNSPKGLKYTEIVRKAYELSHGKDSFDPKEHRGYWSGAFKPRTISRWSKEPSPEAWIPKYTYKEDGRYFINEFGRKKLEELEKKWG